MMIKSVVQKMFIVGILFVGTQVKTETIKSGEVDDMDVNMLVAPSDESAQDTLVKRDLWEYLDFIFTGYTEYEDLKEQNETLKELLAKVLSAFTYIMAKQKEKQLLKDKIAQGIQELVVHCARQMKQDSDFFDSVQKVA